MCDFVRSVYVDESAVERGVGVGVCRSAAGISEKLTLVLCRGETFTSAISLHTVTAHLARVSHQKAEKLTYY